MGDVGADAVHLHFEVFENGQRIDPYIAIPKYNIYFARRTISMKYLYVLLIFTASLSGIKAQESTDTIDGKVNNQSYIDIGSIAVLTPNGEKWFIGKKLDGDFTKKTNVTVSSDLFGRKFGPLNGYKDELMQVGWNNQNRILYIEVSSSSVITKDGISLGDTKEKIFKTIGVPYIETPNEWRYWNLEFEVVGIIFQFENERVVRIILYSYT
jgi:hypothetical protein